MKTQTLTIEATNRQAEILQERGIIKHGYSVVTLGERINARKVWVNVRMHPGLRRDHVIMRRVLYVAQEFGHYPPATLAAGARISAQIWRFFTNVDSDDLEGAD